MIETYSQMHRTDKYSQDSSISLAKWLSVCLRTKWLWVRITLLSLKLQIWRLLRARSSLIFRQTIECGFTLEFVRYMIIKVCVKLFMITIAICASYRQQTKLANSMGCGYLKIVRALFEVQYNQENRPLSDH